MSTSRGADFDALGCGKQHKTLQTFPSTSSGLLCKQHSADLTEPICPVCSEIRHPGFISLIIQAICLLISKCREKLGFKGLILQRVSLGRTPRLSSSRTPGWDGCSHGRHCVLRGLQGASHVARACRGSRCCQPSTNALLCP